MVNVGIRAGQLPTLLIGVGAEVLDHILVNFLLKIHSDCPINTNNFVGADTSIRGNIAAGIRNSDVGGIVANCVMSALDRGCNNLRQELLVGNLGCGAGLRVCGETDPNEG